MTFRDFLKAVGDASTTSAPSGPESSLTVASSVSQMAAEDSGARHPIALHPHERAERIRREVEMIAPRFSQHEGVRYDEANCDWLMIPRYPLPEKWRARWCQLLIVFPAGYPVTPPIGFYLNRQFTLRNGGKDGHLIGHAYHGAPNLVSQGWHWYCGQVSDGAGGWRASTDYRQHDNLWSFLTMVREFLTSEG